MEEIDLILILSVSRVKIIICVKKVSVLTVEEVSLVLELSVHGA